MSHADDLNRALEDAAPDVAASLSDLGRRLYFPTGVVTQSREAARCPVNATTGQITDGHGGARALPSIAKNLGSISPKDAILYPAMGGVPALRDAWRARLAATAGAGLTRPVVTNGLTHGLSTVGDLFVDANTDVIIPRPAWDNYNLMFHVRRQGKVVPWPLLSDGRLDIAGLRRLLSARTRKSVLVLNFPSNPGGYAPSMDEAVALADALGACPHPLVVACDDAYLGMVWEPDRLAGSIFDRIIAAGHPRVLAAKVDGATKELFFFGGRVGFLTFGATGEAARVLENKAIGAIRATTSSTNAASQAMVLQALRDPTISQQREVILSDIRSRYRRMKASLVAARIPFHPHQGAFFVLIPTPSDPEPIRQALLRDGVGVTSYPDARALRVSYASVALDDIDALVEALRAHLSS
jgi:aspartate/methionine/tyrosine aminotransferase